MKTIEFEIKDNTPDDELNKLAFFIKQNIAPAFECVKGVSIKEYSEIAIDDKAALEKMNKEVREAKETMGE